MKTRTLIAVAAVMMATACTNSAQREAEKLLETATYDFEHGRYDIAMQSIDSLRKMYPSAIETRKKALALYQRVSLKQAQETLDDTDKKLQTAIKEYERLKATVDEHKAMLTATAEELDRLTLKRIERDSLQTQFDVQCAKIKYIHKKQKEQK